MLNGHGDDTFALSKPLRANFSSNVWHQPMPAEFYDHLKDSLSTIGHYPAPCAENLAEELATYHHCTDAHILVCNGATEAFYLLAHAFAGQKSLIAVPSFSEYEDACRVHKHQSEFVHTTHFDFGSCGAHKLVWLCNPNNPDGRRIAIDDLESAAQANPETIFVIDEAYIAFSQNAETAVPLCARLNNVVVIKSLTKQFHMPGLRLGYIIGAPTLIDLLKQFKMPWSVNSVAISAGLYICAHQCIHPQFNLSEALETSKALQQTIDSMEGFSVALNEGCYFLVQMASGTATELKAYLLAEHALLIRDASNFRGLSNKHFRIASQTHQQNQLLIAALTTWSNK